MTFNRKTLPGACGFCCKPGLGVVGSMVEAAYPYRTCHHQFACWIQEFFLFTFDACCILYLAFLETHGLGYKKVYPFESSGLVFLPGNLTWKRRFFSVPSKTTPLVLAVEVEKPCARLWPGNVGLGAKSWGKRSSSLSGWDGLGWVAWQGQKGRFFFSPPKKNNHPYLAPIIISTNGMKEQQGSLEPWLASWASYTKSLGPGFRFEMSRRGNHV